MADDMTPDEEAQIREAWDRLALAGHGGWSVTNLRPFIAAADEAVAAYTTKVTEQRDHFSTGSQRGDQTGKGRYDLVPREVIDRYAKLLERGAVAYGDNNWRLGQPYSRVISSMLRHAYQAAAGMTDEDHLAAVIFNAGALITYQEMIAADLLPAELDDLPKAA
jgi:hypothetical protein